MTGEEYAKAKQVKAARKRYDERVAEHRCVTCGEQDERTLAGRTRCAACYAKAYKWPQRMTDESRKSAALKKREFRAAMKAEGRCMNCGAQDYLTLRGKPLCAGCQRRRNRQQKDYRESGGMAEAGKRRRDARRAAGLCTKCGKNRPEEGHVQCTDCLVRDRMYRRRQRAAMEKAR